MPCPCAGCTLTREQRARRARRLLLALFLVTL
jgi:hypothetical protein